VLLAIDTSAGTGVAVVDPSAPGGVVVAEASEADTRRHAEAIDVLISGVLRSAGIGPRDVAAVVAGMGPGPFTGLRVGIAAARTLALALEVRVIPVVSHDAVALGRARSTLVVTDARRREVAWSTYGPPDADGVPLRQGGPQLARPDELAQLVEGYSRYDRIDAAVISAGALGLVAARLLQAGRAGAPDEPLYLRAPDVTVGTGPKRVTG
jgi:tRNA threonylcarbamoyl adenosine modification protein YeaZ